MGYRVAGIVFGGLNQRKVSILSASGCLVSEIQRSILIFLFFKYYPNEVFLNYEA